jgi:hypothetical protein
VFAESSLLAAWRVVNEGHGDALGPASDELPRLESNRILLGDHMLNRSSRSFYRVVNASWGRALLEGAQKACGL